jgi:hypothetical protein
MLPVKGVEQGLLAVAEPCAAGAAGRRSRSMEETEMRRGRKLIGIALAGFTALAVPAGLAWAGHVVIYESRPAPTVVVPSPAITRWPPMAPRMVQADEIKAHQVRAHTIYANRIVADDVQGIIYQSRDQSGDVKVGGKGEIKAPEVSASVIYADEIKANSVVADVIYVRDLRRG